MSEVCLLCGQSFEYIGFESKASSLHSVGRELTKSELTATLERVLSFVSSLYKSTSNRIIKQGKSMQRPIPRRPTFSECYSSVYHLSKTSFTKRFKRLRLTPRATVLSSTNACRRCEKHLARGKPPHRSHDNQ